MPRLLHCFVLRPVAPNAGAWIEILALPSPILQPSKSLPTRERGLKFNILRDSGNDLKVAPNAGAWIEIINIVMRTMRITVAPNAGAWIEIYVRGNG